MNAAAETQIQALRERIGKVGVWLGAIGEAPAPEERLTLARLEELDYRAVWFGESPINREALSHAAMLLQATQRITVASGIANIWVRDATAAINGADTLNEAYDERFVLGLGVSHAPAVSYRGHEYAKPLAAMRAYLDAIDAHVHGIVKPLQPSPVVLAALRPKMLELARDRAMGAHSFFVPSAHTALARQILGPRPLLAPEQGFILEEDSRRARERGRRHIGLHLGLPNYQANLRELGYGNADFADGGSDRLVDAIVAWGDEAAVVARVREHLEAGADHVALQAYSGRPRDALAQLERLAPALAEL